MQIEMKVKLPELDTDVKTGFETHPHGVSPNIGPLQQFGWVKYCQSFTRKYVNCLADREAAHI